MLLPPPAYPQRYEPSVEKREADEDKIGQQLTETMLKISETTYRDGGHAIRSVHAKSHGLLQAELEVIEQDFPTLAQGLFARPARYPAVMRYSTIPGDILDDDVSAPRGLAIKVFDVPGERLPGSEAAGTQDFVMINAPAFGAANGKAFLANLKLLAGTTDKHEGLKKLVSSALRPIEAALADAGHPSATLSALGGQPETHVLGETYYSEGALRYGDYIAKLAVVPVSPELVALHGQKVDLKNHPNGLRDAVVGFFAANGGEWELRAQLCADLDEMPVENAAKVWSEELSPYITVARIRAQPQTAWSDARSTAVDDGYSFSPWHGLAAHRPLGSLMRMRKAAYEASARFRAEHNRHPIQEPRSFTDLPD